MGKIDPLVAVEALARMARREKATETNVPLPALLEACRRERAIARPAMLPLVWPAAMAGLAAAIMLLLSVQAGIFRGSGSATAKGSAQSNEARPQVAMASNLSDSVDPLFAPLRMDLP